MSKHYFKKQRLGLLAVGGMMSAMLAFSLTPTFAGIVASIKNSTNTAATGTLVMKESSGGQNCTSSTEASNSATCGTINKYGGTTTPLIPGGAGNTTEITITNEGNIDATSFTVQADQCTQSAHGSTNGNANNLCEKVNITITSGSHTIFSGSAKAFNEAGSIDILKEISQANVAKQTNVPITIKAALDTSADATYQGLQISQPITWTFGA
ncbi:MAG: hypothetical protein Q4A37_02425 [Candidatus Saccharibacteria bacterium]|nr:hypothetical protein [Candidatus Saccharibacteria bacterium]